MTLSGLWPLFAVIFVVGPLVFWRMTRHAPSPRNLSVLAGVTAGCALIGLILRYAGGALWGHSLLLTGGAIALIWAAWIGILACGVQTMRRSDSSQNMRRWTAALGAFATTLPWFGLATAQMMAG